MIHAHRRVIIISAVAALCAVLAVIALPRLAHADVTTWWYVDCTAGSNGDGTSPASAWNTLAAVNAHTFVTGDGLVFASGTTCTGGLVLHGSGSSGNPILVGVYNSSHGSATPIIAGNGVTPAAVELYDTAYMTFEDLEVTNATTSVTDRAGILVYNDTGNTLSGITITHNHIHDIAGYAGGYYGVNSAIAVDMDSGLGNPGTFDNVTITNNTIENAYRLGIWVGNDREAPATARNTNVTIAGNTINATSSDAIVVRYTSSPQIIGNVVAGAGTLSTSSGCSPTYCNRDSAAVWVVDSSDALMQGNEVYNTSRSQGDGEAFDCDGGTTNCVVQYNYSHNNPFGFYLECSQSGDRRNAIVRYNISQDDGGSGNNAVFNGTTCGQGPTSTALIYNNTVYVSSGNPVIDSGIWSSGTTFTNNIIDNQANGTFRGNALWDHTLFWGSGNRPNNNTNALTGDPSFTSPDGGGNGIGTASAYKLQGNSTAISCGVAVATAPNADFFGAGVSNPPTIGADNHLTGSCGVSSNFVSNPGFESPCSLGGAWNDTAGNASVVSNNAHGGSCAVQTANASSGVNQTIVGLAPNHTYTLTGWVKSANGSDTVYVGAKDFGGSEVNNSAATSDYTQITVQFTTGSGNTTAQIYCWKNGGSAASYCDDFSVTP